MRAFRFDAVAPPKSFGDIYLGLAQNGERVAVKFEKHSTRCPQLRHEYKVYREMQNCSGFGRVSHFELSTNTTGQVDDRFRSKT